MAYDPTNPPYVVAQGANGRKEWRHQNADAPTVVRVSGYFSNGYSLGMRVGDTLRHIEIDAGAVTTVSDFVVNAASIAGSVETVDVTDATALTVTDTD